MAGREGEDEETLKKKDDNSSLSRRREATIPPREERVGAQVSGGEPSLSISGEHRLYHTWGGGVQAYRRVLEGRGLTGILSFSIPFILGEEGRSLVLLPSS